VCHVPAHLEQFPPDDPSPDEKAMAQRTPSLGPLSSLPDKPLRPRVSGPPACILCGAGLRAGQPILRIDGTTIHARCGHVSA
jgi:hypothetical protein